MIDAAKSAGFGMMGTGLVLSAVIGIVTVLTGSGVASFTGLVPIAPTVAAGFGGDPTVLAMMLQLASEFLRPVSPVAGVIIIVAGFAGVSPLAVVRRTWIPCFAGLIVALAATVILF
jgi:DcuC family C4-dicarboxylate transporter